MLLSGAGERECVGGSSLTQSYCLSAGRARSPLDLERPPVRTPVEGDLRVRGAPGGVPLENRRAVRGCRAGPGAGLVEVQDNLAHCVDRPDAFGAPPVVALHHGRAQLSQAVLAQARYLEALIRFSASKSLEDLLTGLAAGLYWSEDAIDDEQHAQGLKLVSQSLLEDLAAAGVPREVIEDAGRYADQQLGHVEREADETALDVYFRLFMGRLLQAYRESRHESGGR